MWQAGLGVINQTTACCGTPAGVMPNGTLLVQVEARHAAALGTEGFQMQRAVHGLLLQAATPAAAISAVFHLMQIMLRNEPLPTLGVAPVVEMPAMQLRIWDLWDNLDGNIERGFGGQSRIWPMALDKMAWNGAVDAAVDNLARLLKSSGMNGIALNNVNACGKNAKLLSPGALASVASTAYPVLARWGLAVYLTPCYAAPMIPGMGQPLLSSVDPLDAKVIAWWRTKVAEIHKLMPLFRGFLVKADSEGNRGPLGYPNRTEADGANLLARAVAPHGGIIMWRAFVYGNGQTGKEDRARQAADTFLSLDGQFDRNVIIQVKNGPMDFVS